MKIIVSIHIGLDARPLLANDSLLRDSVDWANMKYWAVFESDSPILARILVVTHNIVAISFRISTVWAKKELDGAILYLLHPTKGDLPLSDADQIANDTHINKLPYRHIRQGTGVRIVDKFYISSLKKMKPDCAIHFVFDCYFANKDAYNILANESLTGIHFGPVISQATGEVLDQLHLFTAPNILPPATDDGSIIVHTNSNQLESYRIQGCISYPKETISSALDFNCTCEAFGAFDFGLIVVSKNFKNAIEKNKIKGIGFTPVLDASSQLYAEYIKAYKTLTSQILNNPLNSL